MTEFIGARISLISKSEIRYTGTLHEINSETSTVALEQVVSHGTEGRRMDPASEIPGSENVYEYIVFRGSDVKDLRIEEAAKPPPQPVLNDPAILGSSARPYGQPPGQFQPPPISPYYYPQPQRFGPSPGPYPGSHMPPPHSIPQGPHGPHLPGPGQQPGQPQGPPGMYTTMPDGQPGMLHGVPGLGQPQPQPQHHQAQQSAAEQHQQQLQQQAPPPQQQQLAQDAAKNQIRGVPTGPAASRQQQQAPMRQPVGPHTAQQQQSQGRPAEPAPAVPVETKPPPAPAAAQQKPPSPSSQAATASSAAAAPAGPNAAAQSPAKPPAGPKARAGIVPALPLTSPGRAGPARPNGTAATATASASTSSAPRSSAAATASESTSAVQDLANKVNQLALKASTSTPNTGAAATPTATESYPSAPRPRPGTGGFVGRQPRGGYRGGVNATRKVEVPSTDYDFESANAKFNKKDLVKEAIATGEANTSGTGTSTGASGAPTNGDTPNGDANDDVVIPPAQDGFYNRGKSFFDNISCENKERSEAKPGEKRGGAAFRSEEQKKNLETFGQGSVDGGYGGYHGRGRGWRGGRGRGYAGGRGRGYGYGNRGGFRPQVPPPQAPGQVGN